ncbi:MAG: UDP-N-acetylmuramoyl-tripeptide--D-alanyl-D-alanine ligase [Flavobacteriaceae bacterium TMED81]|jgi:UDP-N-acetylmuramoyl-tripeptide--D-alanyl-D-alanine ligase|nr:MAG: UDP-N-acetylmuramoyl-tripeptide--D-alanyl-D-alanine ligase [Flavobacteriaceae bacterium TMED81]
MSALYNIFRDAAGVSTDSRTLQSGQLFFALSGPNFDGNQFAKQALDEGAIAVVVDDDISITDNRVIRVENSLKSLQTLSTEHRKTLGTTIIALTGSNGKTTTKELIHSVLSTTFTSVATQGNLNNHIGVPLNLLSLKGDTEIGIVEMGANHPGEISLLANIAQPDAGLITNFGKAHLEGFGSLEGVVKAKSELYDYLKNTNGLIFANADDPKIMAQLKGQDPITYGTETTARVSATLLTEEDAIRIKVDQQEIQTQLSGAYNGYNALAAYAIGRHFGVSPQNAKKVLESYISKNNRSQLIRKKDLHINLDAYNANPTSMQAALTSFSKKEGKKIAVLGQMNELGKHTETEHKLLVDWIKTSSIDDCYWVGSAFASFVSPDKYFSTVDQAMDYFSKTPLGQASLLVKGSRSFTLEKLVDVFH